jgi:hypothetical protein
MLAKVLLRDADGVSYAIYRGWMMLLLLVIVDMARGLLAEDERELSELRPSSMREG